MARGEITGRKPRVTADRVERTSGPPIPNETTPTPHAEPKSAPVDERLTPERGKAVVGLL